MSNYNDIFKDLKKCKLDTAVINLWVVKRSIKDMKAKYKVLSTIIESNIEKKLLDVTSKYLTKNNEIKEYAFITEDHHDDIYALNSDETSFSIIFDEIKKGSDGEKLIDIKDLLEIYSYVIELKNNNFHILAFRKTENWKRLKKSSFINLIFREHRFINVEEDKVFSIDTNIDFIFYKDKLFILNKKNFEEALNFREGMKKNRDEVLGIFKEKNIIDNIEKMKENIGENLKYLRKISTIKKNGYYTDSNFIGLLKKVNEDNNFGLKFDNNRIIYEEDKLDLILTLLNNDRLKSVINEELFDVSIKKKVSK
jgi:hypothetical protein